MRPFSKLTSNTPNFPDTKQRNSLYLSVCDQKLSRPNFKFTNNYVTLGPMETLSGIPVNAIITTRAAAATVAYTERRDDRDRVSLPEQLNFRRLIISCPRIITVNRVTIIIISLLCPRLLPLQRIKFGRCNFSRVTLSLSINEFRKQTDEALSVVRRAPRLYITK